MAFSLLNYWLDWVEQCMAECILFASSWATKNEHPAKCIFDLQSLMIKWGFKVSWEWFAEGLVWEVTRLPNLCFVEGKIHTLCKENRIAVTYQMIYSFHPYFFYSLLGQNILPNLKGIKYQIGGQLSLTVWSVSNPSQNGLK